MINHEHGYCIYGFNSYKDIVSFIKKINENNINITLSNKKNILDNDFLENIKNKIDKFHNEDIDPINLKKKNSKLKAEDIIYIDPNNFYLWLINIGDYYMLSWNVRGIDKRRHEGKINFLEKETFLEKYL